jgi:hypothetical protein
MAAPRDEAIGELALDFVERLAPAVLQRVAPLRQPARVPLAVGRSDGSVLALRLQLLAAELHQQRMHSDAAVAADLDQRLVAQRVEQRQRRRRHVLRRGP